MNFLTSIAGFLLNLVVGGIIVVGLVLFAVGIISSIVGDQLQWGKLLRPALICVVSLFVCVIISSQFHDSSGDVVYWAKPFQFISGVLSGLAATVVAGRIFFAAIRHQSNLQRKYQQWYSSLTLEQRLLEDIRRNTARQAIEAAEIREILEQRRKNGPSGR